MRNATPVLLIGFNRPDRLQRLIDAVRLAAPERVYVAIDGPRPGNASDAAGVAACRALVSQIDWTADVHVCARPTNLGCGRAVSGALDWFFSTEEYGIILEDDLVPDVTFFDFCTELLERYANTPEVFAISGCNVVPMEHIERIERSSAYRFTQIPQIWGWATWRRTWQQYSLDIRGWRRGLPLIRRWRVMGRSLTGLAYWTALFDLLAAGRIDTWDGQLVYAAMRTGGLTAISNVNLVANEGFGADATHTVRRPDFLRPSQSLAQPLTTSNQVPIRVDRRADRWMRVVAYQATWRGLARQASRYLSHRRSADEGMKGALADDR